MASSLSSLGLGSDGALSYDVIDQLRAVDEKAQVTPIENKITANENKLSDLSILTTLTATFKSSTSSLSDELTYLKRESSVTGDSVNVVASSGTAIQDFSIDVKNLATRDIYQSESFASSSSTFASSSDTLTFEIDGQSYSIDIDASTTISELKDKINDSTDGKITASLLNVGGDEPYRLIIKSTDTGADNAISISSLNGNELDLGFANHTYSAAEPTGTYDGSVNGDDTLTFNINGTDYNVTVSNGQSINDLVTTIQNDANLSKLLKAEVVDGKLTLESSDDSMTISSIHGSDAVFGLDNLTTTQDNHIQTAANATFDFNGVTISRDTNSIEDLIVGVTINLNTTGQSNVKITQKTSDISENLQSFVSSYNELMSNLNETIKYDTDTKNSGTFQGVSEIITMKADINRQLLSVDAKGRALSDFGIKLNESGMLEFDEDVFNAKLSEDASQIEEFFRGKTTFNPTVVYGSSVSSGAIDITSGNFTINGKNIIASLNGTASENALALKNAINSADIDGVQAYLDSTGSYVYLKSNSGDDIEIKGDSGILNSIGFKSGTTRGSTETSIGIFSDFNDLLNGLIDGTTSTLGLLETRLENEKDSLSTERTATIKNLDDKYQIMANRFAAYDSIIGKLNTQFNTLSMMIQQSYGE
ncbi:MAG: flagellar hook-associated protein 2 [Sulfurospirillum sp.]|jgi:flagellar hook-associated protein 2|nr:flagellar hook-associated protein 2 [Sulfurospirillum sp.]